MVSDEKVKQIISSLKESNVYNFDDEQFKELLSLLNVLELELFKNTLKDTNENDILNKYLSLESDILNTIHEKLNALDDTELVSLFKASLLTNKYVEYLSALGVPDLQTIRFYISNKVNVDNKDNLNGTIKLNRIISKLLKEKETHKFEF